MGSDIGVYLTFIISWLVAIVGFAQYFYYLRVKPQYKKLRVLLMVIFWLAASAVWLLVGLEEVFIAIGNINLAYILFFAAQLFVGMMLIIGYWYYSRIYFSRNAQTAIVVLVSACVMIMEYIIFSGGVFERPSSHFSHHLLINAEGRVFFAALLFPVIAMIIVDAIKNYRQRWKFRFNRFYRFSVYATISFIIISVGGTADEIGLASDWLVTLVRIFHLLAALIGLIAVQELTCSDDDLIV